MKQVGELVVKDNSGRRGWSDLIADFEDGRKDRGLKNVSSLQRLGKTRKHIP